MSLAKQLKETMDKLAPRPEKITQQDSEPLPDLTPEEEQEAIRVARETKAAKIRTAKYWDKVNREEPVKLYTAKELEGKLRVSKNAAGKPFVIDKDNEKIVGLLCLYFSMDPEFEKHVDNNGNNFSLDKGLALLGNVGIGKTHLMGFFFQNQNQSYTMANCRKIEGRWCDEIAMSPRPQPGVIDFYSNEIKTHSNPFRQLAIGVCFDDLGTETVPSKAYGEEKHVLAEIMMNRYESGIPRNYTHITSNLSAHDIGIKYGTRVKDRFREMFNLIQFPNEAKSRR